MTLIHLSRFARFTSVARRIVLACSILISASPVFAESDSRCQKRLEKALSEETLKDQFRGLKRAAQRCKDYAPVQSILAEFYLDYKSAAHEDWLQLAIHHYEVALAADPLLLSASWEVASLWAVLGEYERASVYFGRLSESSATVESKYPGPDAAANCFSACKLLASLPNRPKVDLDKSGKKAAARLSVMDSVLIRRAEWSWLKQWACAVAVAGGDNPKSRLGAHLAGCLIVEFQQHPYVQERVQRILQVSGMIAHLSTLMKGQQLTGSVDELLSLYAERPTWAWPEAHAGGDLEIQFASAELDTLRSCEFSSDLNLSHVWRIPDLKGIWNCRAELAAPDKEITPIVEFEVELRQQDDSVFIVFPKIEGYVEEKSLLVLVLRGHRLSTVYWQSLAGRRKGPRASITGTATLSRSYASMEGPFAIHRDMDLDSQELMLMVRNLSADQGPGSLASQLLDKFSVLDNSRVDGGKFTFTRK